MVEKFLRFHDVSTTGSEEVWRGIVKGILCRWDSLKPKLIMPTNGGTAVIGGHPDTYMQELCLCPFSTVQQYRFNLVLLVCIYHEGCQDFLFEHFCFLYVHK